MNNKNPGIHGEGYGTGLPNDGDYSDAELRALPFLASTPFLTSMYCEDYPCCGHTDQDPCPGRAVTQDPWYCDYCGTNHIQNVCPND